MIIRKFSENDFNEIFNMMKDFYNSPALLHPAPDDILKKDILDCLGDCPYVEGYLFEENGKAAGYSMLAVSYSTEYGGICIWVEDLYIKPEYRGKGMGTAFFDFLKRERKEAVRFRLEAESGNHGAIELYKRNGFSLLPYVQLATKI